MTKVLHVISGLGVGGAETMLVQVAGALAGRGHPQHVVSLRGRDALADALEARGVGVTDLSVTSSSGLMRALPRLRGVVAAFAPDAIQGWMYHGNLAAMLAHYAGPGRARRTLFWGLRASNMDGARYGGVIRLGAWLSSLPNAVIANSQAGADFHRAQGFRPRRMEIVPNGIDTDTFRPDADLRAAQRAALGLAEDEVVAVHVARVDAMKDHAMFLAAMRLVPGMRAVLIGAGTEALALPDNVRALGVRSDVARLYPLGDIAVSSSAFGEGFSNTLAEGMSAGLVPVATDVGDARAIVGETGEVVPPRDVQAFAAALRTIASLPEDERRARGLAARERIVTQFAIARAVDRFERLYRGT